MAQLSIQQKALPLSLSVAGSHAVLEMLAMILPVTYPLLIAERGFTYSQIGTLAFVATVSTTLAQPLFGWISDRTDAKTLTIGSLVWISLVMSLVGLVRSYGLLLVCVGAAMLAGAAYHPAAASLVSRFGRKETAMSFFATGGAIGGALSPLLAAALLTSFGLRGTLGLMPIGLLLAGVVMIALRGMPEAVRPKRNSSTSGEGSKLALLLVVVLTGSRAWVEGSLVNYLPEWQIQRGASLTEAGGMLAMFSISFAVGGFISGFLCERFGRFQVTLVSLLMMLPGIWLLLNLPPTTAPFALVLLGCSAGISNPIAILMAQAAWPQGVGIASSLAIGIGYVPAGIGAFTIGRLADSRGLDFALSTITFVPLIAVVALIAYRFAIPQKD